MQGETIGLLLSVSPLPTVLVAKDLEIVASNQAAGELLGLSRQQNLSAHFVINDRDRDHIGNCFKSSARRLLSLSTKAQLAVHAVGWRIGGALRDEKLIILQFEPRSNAQSRLSNMTNVLEQERQRARRLFHQNYTLARANARLEEHSKLDPMTKLLNAQAIRAAMEGMAQSGATFGVVYLDLNNLKIINDTYGHGAGDAAIMSLTAAIKANIRGCDIAGRMGGDEFAILIAGPLDEGDVRLLAERIANALADHASEAFPLGPDSYSTAIGAALWPHDASDLNTLIEMADSAMYHSKRKSEVLVLASQLSASRGGTGQRLN